MRSKGKSTVEAVAAMMVPSDDPGPILGPLVTHLEHIVARARTEDRVEVLSDLLRDADELTERLRSAEGLTPSTRRRVLVARSSLLRARRRLAAAGVAMASTRWSDTTPPLDGDALPDSPPPSAKKS